MSPSGDEIGFASAAIAEVIGRHAANQGDIVSGSLRAIFAAAAAATLTVLVPLAAPAGAQTGGFVESATSTEYRAPLSAAELLALLPARGRFTFPSPYFTVATRLTNAADCGGGDCVNYVGYAYWSNINNHVSSQTMLIFLGLDRSRGGPGPSLFSYNKTTGETRSLGPLFDSSSPLSLATGEGWYFSGTRASALYLNDGPWMLRYDVLAKTFETVYDVRALVGRNDVYVWQMHSSADDRVHSATVKLSSTFQPIGCVAYREDTGQSYFFPAIGDFDECQIDKSGRWLVIKDNLDGRNGEDNRIIDLQTGVEQSFYDEDGAAGHSDVGFGYLVAEDDHASQPGTARLWKLNENFHAPGQGVPVYHLTSWSSGLGHITHGNARPAAPLDQQIVCTSNATRLALPRVNEIVCYRLDGSLQALVVAPNMTDLDAPGGGGDDYSKLPKGNLDVTGEYFIWTSNTGSNRLDAFIVHVPQARLTGSVVPTVTADSATPSGGTGGSQRFDLQYSSSTGASDISTAWVWVNATFAGAANSCMVYYDRATQIVRLLNDGGTTWMAGVVGGPSTLQIGQCAIALGNSAAVLSGNTLTLSLAMTFSASFAGVKNVYMFAAAGDASSGWQDRGNWTVPAGPAPTVTADAVNPASGSGTAQRFDLQYSSSNGAGSISTAWAWFNAAFAGAASSCMVYYDRATQIVRLLNDAGTTWMAGAIGGPSVLQNSQCAIALADSTAVLSGNTLTLSLAMTFTGSFAGVKNVYTFAAAGDATSGWHDRADWTVPAGVVPAMTADSVNPASGSGTTQTFDLQYSSSTGAGNISTAWVWFNATFAGAVNSCMVYYERATQLVRLLNDAGTTWMAGAVGSPSTLQNGQCAIALANSAAVLSGNTLTLSLAMTFTASFAGAKNVYMFGAAGDVASGWQDRGDWTVPAGIVPAVTADSVTPSGGTGTAQTFDLQYSSSTGAGTISTVWVWFNAAFAATANSCMVFYDRATQSVWLLNDAGTTWAAGALGGPGTLQNGQCAVALANSAAVLSGNTLTLSLATTFTPSFAGVKNVYMFGAAGDVASGWHDRGDWTVP